MKGEEIIVQIAGVPPGNDPMDVAADDIDNGSKVKTDDGEESVFRR